MAQAHPLCHHFLAAQGRPNQWLPLPQAEGHLEPCYAGDEDFICRFDNASQETSQDLLSVLLSNTQLSTWERWDASIGHLYLLPHGEQTERNSQA